MGATGGAAAIASNPTDPRMRLGLHLEQRGDVGRLVDKLHPHTFLGSTFCLTMTYTPTHTSACLSGMLP